MLVVDDRAGSGELAPLLRAKGLPVVLARQMYGDVSFVGFGPGGEPVPIGIEVKSIRDVIQCMTNGRFAGHQLPGLVETYSQIYLLIEGGWKPCPRSGVLLIRKNSGQWIEATVGTRRFMYKDLLSWLFTVSIKGGVRVQQSSDWNEAIIWLSSLYRWWTVTGTGGRDGYDEHTSHLAINVAHDAAFYRDSALLVRPSLLRRVAKELPGVGIEKSAAVANCFSSVRTLVEADPDTIALVPGIGKTMAVRIWEAIRQGE